MPTVIVRKLSDVAAVIRAAREDVGVTQEELAERLAFSRDYMVDLDSGRGSVYATRLLWTLHDLGITMTLTYRDHDAEP